MSFSVLLVLGLAGLYLMLRGQARHATARTEDPDAATLAELAHAGSDLAREHQMEFFLYLPDREAAEAVARQLTAEGFRVEIRPAETAPECLCLATRSMNPELGELQRLRRYLTAVAESRDGAYDGWGATVVEAGEER
jgi:regulator of RNase E activity RraB